jgi:hypothetical protein
MSAVVPMLEHTHWHTLGEKNDRNDYIPLAAGLSNTKRQNSALARGPATEAKVQA